MWILLTAAFCMMLLSGCGDTHAREYRKHLRALEKLREKAFYSLDTDYPNYYDNQYEEILTGMETMPG